MINEEIILEQIPSVLYDLSITYQDQLKMLYIDLVAHLIAKCGHANRNYFCFNKLFRDNPQDL